MAGEEGKVYGIEKFDGSDFGYWKMQIEDYLYGKSLEAPLIGKKPEKMSDAEWETLDRRVLVIIRLTLSKTVSHNIANEKTVSSMMAVLSSMYEKPSANNKVHLMKKLLILRCLRVARLRAILMILTLLRINCLLFQLSSTMRLGP